MDSTIEFWALANIHKHKKFDDSPALQIVDIFSFKIIKKQGNARAGVIKTPHGIIKTPMFMPVGTYASVKALSPEDLKKCGVEIILGGNTYHMMIRRMDKIIEKQGGMHKFMNWDKVVLTDSGGFQVFSMKGLGVKITDQGVYFTSHLDGKRYFMGPEESIGLQEKLGADIIMSFDECVPDKASKDYIRKALERTEAWAKKGLEFHERNGRRSSQKKYQALFGIIQGGRYKDLRRQSAEFICLQDFDGIAFGGETIGYNIPFTQRVIDWTQDLVPENKPYYTMGVGNNPQDVIDIVRLGIDIFDCVAPTRLARNGALYHGELVGDGSCRGFSPVATHKGTLASGVLLSASPVVLNRLHFESEFPKGRLNISNNRFKLDKKPIQENCDCDTCRSGFTRAYLHHLYKTKELLYYRLASIHNVRFMVRLCERLREIILK